jgi:hypothetical protein
MEVRLDRGAPPFRSLVRTWFVLLPVLVTAACGHEAVGGPRAEVRDSAGIRVVLNPPPDAADDARWTVGAEPEVEIGVLDGAPEYLLFDVSGGVVLTDGVLVVANRGTSELRFYDGRGKYLRSAGGEGDGPGEFRDLEFVDRFAGDSLLAFDGRNLRASVFDRGGRFARSFGLGELTNSTYPGLAGVLSTGAVVKREGHPYMAGVATTGADRSPVLLLLAGPTGVGGDTLGVFPGSETFVMAVPADMWMTVRLVTFGPRFVTAVTGDRIAVATTDTFAVRVYAPEGALRQIVRQRRMPVPVEPGDFTRFGDSLMSTAESETSRRHYREMLELMPKHETFPAFASMRFDRVGNLWVEDYPRSGDPGSVWQVFDDEGLFAARAQVPAGLRVLDIGGNYILGVVKDEMGVERLRVYALERR